MNSTTIKRRISALGAILTVSLYEKRYQAVVHIDSRIHPHVEGLPLPDLDEAIEHALNNAERIKRKL